MAYEQLQTLLLSAGKKQADLARLIKKTPAVVTNLFSGIRKLDAKEAQIIANWLGVEVSHVIGGPGTRMKVPVVGTIAEGGLVSTLNDLPLAPESAEHYEQVYVGCEMVDAPPGSYPDGLLALRVIDNALKPIIPNGSVVYYSPRLLGDTPRECMGKLCVVQVRTGQTLLRIVDNSIMAGRFDLVALNTDSMRDVELAWCAKVLFIKPF